jgi:Flp pilus assembly protein TadD
LGLYYLGHCRSAVNDCAKALEHYRQSLDFAPKDKRSRAMIYLALGICQERTNETARARQSYYMALQLNPGLTEARNGLARLSPLSESNPN